MPTSPLNRDPAVARVSGSTFILSYSLKSWAGLELSPPNTGQGLLDFHPDISQLLKFWSLIWSQAGTPPFRAVPFQDKTWAGVTTDLERHDFTEANQQGIFFSSGEFCFL